jgi:hypothetical protein
MSEPKRGLAELLASKPTVTWLRTPNPAFLGDTPIQIIEREGSKGALRVAYELECIELNVPEEFRRAFPGYSKKPKPGQTNP